jgi:diguanylate cyclase (GGDEF)-like protein/PAS domain S-box-containing protein
VARLRVRLLLLVILAIVPALGLALDVGLNDRQAALDNARRDAQDLARVATSANDHLIVETSDLLAGLVRVPAIRDAVKPLCDDLLGSILKDDPLYANLTVINLNGDVVCSGVPAHARDNLADRRFFRAVVETGEFAALDYNVDRASGHGVLLAGFPILDDDGHIKGVLSASLDLTWLTGLADEMHFPAAVKLIVFDRGGTIWLQYPATGPAVGPVSGAGSVRRQVGTQPEGTGDYLAADGTPYLYAYVPLKSSGPEPTAYVSVSTRRDEILAPADAALSRHLVGLGVVALLALAAAWYGGHAFLLRRLEALVKVTARLASGDLEVRSGLATGADEISDLARAFDDMASSLHLQDGERRRAEDERTQLAREQVARIEAELARERIASILESIADGFLVVDHDWRVAYVNRPAALLFEADAAELVGCSFWDVCPAYVGARFAADYERAAAEQRSVNFEASDEAHGRWFEVHVAPARDGLLVSMCDVSERAAAQLELNRLAFSDPLTTLPNRQLFLARLEQALERAACEQRRIAVLFVDLDNFKLINDSLGHAEGDRLLKEVGQRLAACVAATTSGSTVARFGGDEFTVLIEEGAVVAGELAEQLALVLRAPVVLHARDVFISASIGVAVSTPRESGAEELLRDADVAMYRAKSSGKARFAVFTPSMNADALARLEVETDLRRALSGGELRLNYQPIYSLATGAVHEVEALLRWAHPKRGLVSPAEFIPVAEETGLIVPIGQWVLEQACQQARDWDAERPDRAPLGISVNLSARQFQHPELVADIRSVLERTGLLPRRLTLEITETAVMQDADAAVATLQALTSLGVHIAIDDFGTGYSSLSYLKRFPVDTLKIDRSFVQGLGQDEQNVAIVRSVIALASALMLGVVGEGIETHAEEAQLRALGCEQGQGYLFARPMTAAALAVFLAADQKISALRRAA